MIRKQASQTRAQAPARKAGAVTVRAIRLPKEARRVPLVLVDVERAGLRLTFAVARLRGGALDVRPPRGPDGIGDGIWLPDAERERIGNAILAAVQDDPDAARILR